MSALPSKRFEYNCLAIRDGDGWERNVLPITTDQHRVSIDTGRGRDTSNEEFRRIGHEVPARRPDQLRDKLELIEAGVEKAI